MLGLGARELLYGRAETSDELPARMAAITPDQVRAAAAALRGTGRGVLLVEPSAQQWDPVEPTTRTADPEIVDPVAVAAVEGTAAGEPQA
jgi:zinc protease